MLCVPYERARGGQLHDKDIVVIERVRRGGAFERTIKQIILKNSKCSLVSRSSEPRYPSIEINAKTMTEKDGTIVRIVGLAIAVCHPAADGLNRSDFVDRLGASIVEVCGSAHPLTVFACKVLCVMYNAKCR